jgi:hypothetical protein
LNCASSGWQILVTLFQLPTNVCVVWLNNEGGSRTNKENATRCNSVSNFISYLYEAQHVSGDIPSIIRSLKLH